MTQPTSEALLIIAQQMNEQGVDFRTDVHGIEALCLQEAANEIERLRNEIERLRAELAAQNWQPIETAPKDRTDVLLLNDTGRRRRKINSYPLWPRW